MSGFFGQLRDSLKRHRELMLLPLLVILLVLTAIIVFNRDAVRTPFVYSGF